MKIPSPRGGPHASRKRFPWSAPITAAAGGAHALLARGLPILIIIIIALAALVLSSVGHAQTLDPVLVSNIGQTAGSDLATATGRVTYAQSFTTGDHPDGYFLSSVQVGLKADSGVTAEVALWWSNRVARAPRIGFYFLPIRILTPLSGVGSIDNDAATLERFSANDVLLLPATTYWIVVTRTGGADDGLSVATTSSEAAVDAGGMAGFSVGNNVWVPVPDSPLDPDAPEWADYSGSVDASMKIGLRGSEATRPPGPYATNRNEQSRAAAAETSSSTSRYATSFTTASNPDTHQLTSVLLGVAAEAGVSPRVAIHADASGGEPAASALANGTLTAPADVSRVLGAPDRAEFTASTAISLAGGTRYWVVLDVGSGSGSLSVSTTARDVNDNMPQPQWPIGNRMKAYSGTSWSNDSQSRSFRMALNGPTDQYIGPPFDLMREVRIGLPQVGVGVAAEIYDESFRVKNATWQWQWGETSDGTFTDILAAQGGTSRVYVPAAADLGKWLKALVTYENAFGLGLSLSGVSVNAVLSQPIMSNAGQISDLNYLLQEPALNIAQAFTTGGNRSGYSLSGLRFGIRIDTDADALSWALYADNAGEPAAAPLFTHITVPSDSLDASVQTFEDLVHPGFPLAPDTKYWAVLTSSPLMEGTGSPFLGFLGISEFGDLVILDGPAAELDPGSESGWTLDFSPLSSTTTTVEWVPLTGTLELEPTGKMVLRMSVLTYPEVTASFGQASYTVAEGATQSVTVTLSADPERAVTIPIVTMGQDGATDADYSGVPDSVTFISGETEQTFTFTAVQDTVDDEGESVLLGFGPDLSGGVRAGTPDETTLTITDDDPPEVSFGQSAYTVAEGGMVSVEVKLTSAPASAVTVPVTHTPQSATSAADYSGVPANVTFSAGDTSESFTFTATDDTVDDDDERVLLGFGVLPTDVSTGGTPTSTVTITDNDDPAVMVSFGSATYTVAEGGTVEVTVTLDPDPERTVIIPITTVNQGAASDADYSGVPSGVTFQSGETSKSFDFSATQDTEDDDDESVRLGFGSMPDARVSAGTPDETTVNITDDDVPSVVVVSFGSAAYTVTEGGTVEVTVTLDDDPERTITVPIATANVGGISDSDYSGVPGSVTFSAGDTRQAFTFAAADDNLDDSGEGVKLSFVNLPPEATLGMTSEATVTIINKAAQNSLTVAFQSVAYSVPEGNSVVVTVILSAAPGSEVTVPLTVTEQGGATSADYSGVPASVTFGPNERDQTFTVSATQDMVDDDGESVVIGFGTLSDGVREGGVGNTTVDIRDDDDPPEVSFGQSAYTVAEGGTVSVEVKLTSAPASAVTVPVTHTPQGATSSTDYSGVPANVMFSAGETSKAFTFTATQDTVDDDGESVLLEFGTLPATVQTGTMTQSTVTITDDDAAAGKVALALTPATINESGTGNASTVTASIPSASTAATTVTVSVNPADTTMLTGNTTLTIPAGDTNSTGVVTITAVNDDAYAGNRTVAVSGTAVNSVGVTDPDDVTLTIREDDAAAGKVALALTPATINESGTGNASTVTASIPSASTAATTVTVSVNPADTTTLTGNTTLSIPAGDTNSTGVVTITAVNDDAYTGNRTVAVSGTAVNSVGVTDPDDVTLTIREDDAAAGKVALALTPATINESGTGNASTVTASVPSASTAATTVTVSVNPADTTTLTGNTTLSIPAGDTNSTGVVTITAVNDDAYTGNRTVAVSGTAVSSAGVTDPDDVTLTITDDDIPAGCESGDIWCGTVRYTDRFPSDAAGRKPLRWYHLDSDVPEFAHNGFRYKVYSSSLGANPGGGTYVMPPFHIPERSKSLFGLGNLSATDPMGHWEMPNQDYLDWTLYISTNQDGATLEAKLPFNEAKFCCGHKWRWYGLDLYELNYAWAVGKEYQLRIVEDPRADRTPEVLGPPLYLEAPGVERESAHLRWVRPQVRNDGAPPGVKYKVQWKTAAGMWDTPAVSEQVYVPPSGEEVLSWRIRGLTPGSAYDMRVIAVNEAGDSAPSKVLRVHTDEPIPAPSQNQAANSPATGGPGIIGSLLAGETLTATTENIEDEDGLTGAVFAYQWIRSDTDIEGAISSTYTMTDDDAGKAIQVRVTFSDDAGNGESLTSYARLSAPPLPPAQQDDDGPAVVVNFGSSAHSVTEGGTVEVTVTLDVDPERTVTVPLTVTDQDGASPADYSEVPASVTFDSGEISKTVTFSATRDDVDDDGESVKLAFGTPPPRVSVGTGNEFTVNIQDDDGPAVVVSFGSAAYSVIEGSTVKVKVEVALDVDPERTVTVPLTVTDQDGASPADYSGVPASVTFNSGEVLKTFTFSATRDDVDDDGESVKLTFGTPLPARVSAGTGNESTVNIQSKTPLTASVESAPPSHNGSDEFRIRIDLSEEPKTGFSYTTMRDHAFTVTGGSVAGARRLDSPSNIGWEVVVEPDSNGDVSIVLPITTDCNAQGAICTGDGRPLSNRLEITVSGPSG